MPVAAAPTKAAAPAAPKAPPAAAAQPATASPAPPGSSRCQLFSARADKGILPLSSGLTARIPDSRLAPAARPALFTYTSQAIRSATAHSAAKADGTYDVAIIGAGCIGAAVARELSKTTASVVVLEAADDVCQGATKGNSGIVHAGYDDKPGSTRARLCWKGNQMFPELDKDLHFGYQLTGSMVVARGPDEEKHLQELLERGSINGVQNLRIVKEDELKRLEPTLDPECTAALFSPDAGTLIPYEYTIALAENAADNGVEVRTRRSWSRSLPGAVF